MCVCVKGHPVNTVNVCCQSFAELRSGLQALHMLPDSHIPQLSKTTLETVVSDFIILVTGIHLSVGTVGEYLKDPQHGAGAKVHTTFND